ncbi:lipopolysaccharide biosynthesis protein [Glacieibacterium frigidum]|uniref:Oligosaccharide flippase family protein n=1 Tax=Glacieibacterium frigidum TaxID=2593303 RepID=A0A552U9I2_9SPHN|nr:oligosaccharide flippase family protein [Glacieibacterium frigidum]TRW14876.1 oligosaccharide flippase family protein [Glacieibacterium frigidum]
MSTRRNIVANYIGQGVAAVVSLAVVPIYIRYLGIEAYGLVGLFATLQVWMTLLDLGMTPTLGREMARYTAGRASIQFIRDLLRSLEILVFGLAAIIAVALYLASDWIARDWLDPGALGVGEVARALALVGVVIALRFCEGIYRSAIIGLQQQVWLNVAGVTLALLRSGGAVALLTQLPTIDAFFIWQGVISLVTLLAYAAKLHFGLPRAARRPRFSLDALRTVRGFAGGIFATTILAVLLTQVDKLLLSRLLSLADFGYYMIASTVTGGILIIIGPVLQAVYPALVRLVAGGDDARLASNYHTASQVMTVLLGPAALTLIFFADGVILAWSGDAKLVVHTAPILAALAVGTFLNALMQVPHHLQLAAGWTSLALYTNVVAVVLLVPALLWGVPRYGPVAAAVIWAVLNAGYVVTTIPIMHRRLLRGEQARWYLADVALPLAAAALVFGAGSWLADQLVLDRLAWLVFLPVVAGLALVAAVLAASALRQRLFAAFAEVARRRRLSPSRLPPGAAPK